MKENKEQNIIIAGLYKAGVGPTEIAQHLNNVFGVKIDPRAISERRRGLQHRGVLDEYAELFAASPTKEPVQSGEYVVPETKPQPPAVQSFGLSEAELRAKHDNVFIVRKKVAELKPGFFIPESDFIQSCNLKSSSGYRPIIESKEFEAYRGTAGGRVYWGHKDDIQRLKNEGVLR